MSLQMCALTSCIDDSEDTYSAICVCAALLGPNVSMKMWTQQLFSSLTSIETDLPCSHHLVVIRETAA